MVLDSPYFQKIDVSMAADQGVFETNVHFDDRLERDLIPCAAKRIPEKSGHADALEQESYG